MVLLLTTLGLALASEPEISVEPSGHVVGRVTIAAPVETVRAALADPESAGELSPDVVEVRGLGRTGACQEVVTETRGLWRNLVFRSRRCETAQGWNERLVHSEDFSRMDSSWTLRPQAEGTVVDLRVATEVNLPVPDGVLRKRAKKNVAETLKNLARRVLGK